MDIYFLHFEKIAQNLKWPKEHWTLLLQSVLIGKARDVYTQLSVGQSSSYETVKEMILKSNELALEAYRQQFRNCRKNFDQTYVEFARIKEQLFDKWCSSKKVGQDFEKIRQLLLIEEFKWGLSNEIKTYLSEQKVDTLDNAAWLADDYSLTHKVTFVSKPHPQQYAVDKQLFQSYGNTIKSQSGTPSTSRARNQASNKSADQKTYYDVFCNFCNKNGHFRSDC